MNNVRALAGRLNPALGESAGMSLPPDLVKISKGRHHARPD